MNFLKNQKLAVKITVGFAVSSSSVDSGGVG